MAYTQDGYPAELANKIGHVKLIQDPMIERLVEAWEDCRPPREIDLPAPTAHIDLDGVGPVKQVITVDGGHQVVPNIVLPERQVGFVQVAAQLVHMDTLDFLNAHPMADPREVRQTLSRFTHHTLAAIPVAGIHIPGQTTRESIRDAVHRFLRHYELYDGLSYLVYRSWQDAIGDPPSMECVRCGRPFVLERYAVRFSCPACREQHTLSDYLGLCQRDAEDRSTAETVSNLRSVLELLVLFSLIIKFRDRSPIMDHTLFLLDGPLLLRAQLSRLVEPIRALVSDQTHRGLNLYLVGVEKTGTFRSFADVIGRRLDSPGDYYVPSTQYVLENIQGRSFDPATYRNRVNYGAKVVLRAGTNHVLALDVPTGDYILEPKPRDLIGFPETAVALARLVSYRFENALIPLVLANSEASISNQPSGGLLAQFVERVLAHE